MLLPVSPMEEFDINNMCRTCAKYGANVSLFVSGKPNEIGWKLMAVSGIKIHPDDGIPQKMCEPCADELAIAFAFKILCRKSCMKFKKLVKPGVIKVKQQNKIDDHESVKFESKIINNENNADQCDNKNEHFSSTNCDVLINASKDSDHNSCHNLLLNLNTEKNKTSLVNKKIEIKPLQSSKKVKKNKKGVQQLEENLILKPKLIKNAETIPKGETNPTGPIACDDCDRVCPTISYYLNHKRVHSGEKPFKCLQCPSAFALNSTLTVHMRLHTGERPYKCSICGKSFIHKSHLTTHQRVHSGVKPYSCPYCPKSFSQRATATNHARMHTGEKPFICNFCGKAFSWKKYLTDHMRIHTGEHPYKCTICEKGFSNSANIRVHMRTHTGEKPYECDICKRKFSQMDNMLNHRNGHIGLRPHACSSCDKAFLRKSHLTRHKRTHHIMSVDQQCKICNKWVINLKNHTETHQAEKKFTCELCSKGFTVSHSLTRHLKNVHSIVKYNSETQNNISGDLELDA